MIRFDEPAIKNYIIKKYSRPYIIKNKKGEKNE